MNELGVSPYSSYIFLGLTLSIGWLVWMIFRDSARKKQEREALEKNTLERSLLEIAEQARREAALRKQREPGATADPQAPAQENPPPTTKNGGEG